MLFFESYFLWTLFRSVQIAAVIGLPIVDTSDPDYSTEVYILWNALYYGIPTLAIVFPAALVWLAFFRKSKPRD